MNQSEIQRAQCAHFINLSPFGRHLAIEVLAVDSETGQIRLRLPYADALQRLEGSGQVHGGVIAALIDIAASILMSTLLSGGSPTINIRVDYLRPARRTDLLADAVLRRLGASVGVVDVNVNSLSGELVAIGRGNFSAS